MFNSSFLPRKKGIGVQLGIGIRDSNAYVSTSRDDNGLGRKWIFDNDYESAKSTKLHLIRDSQEVIINAIREEVVCPVENRQTEELTSSVDDDMLMSSSTEEGQELVSPKLLFDDLDKFLSDTPMWIRPFRSVELSIDRQYETMADIPISPRDFVPEELLSRIESQEGSARAFKNGSSFEEFAGCSSNKCSADNLRDFEVVDPNDAELFSIGGVHTTKDLRLNYDHQNIICFASGPTNSILNVATLCHYLEIIKMKDQEVKTSKSYSFQLNPERKVTSFDLRSTIKKIKIGTLSPVLNRFSNLLAAITDNGVHFIKIENINTSTGEIITSRPDPLPFSALEDFPIADVTFNPWDINEFAVIDTKGNWCKGMLSKSNCRKLGLSLTDKGTIFDPEEVSSWKKIEWSGNHNKLFAMDRSKLIELNFQDDSQFELVQAKSWSSLRDFKRVSDDYCILLTSKEIIIINSRGHVAERVLSWKHDLEPSDTTLKVSVQEVLKFKTEINLYYIYVFSHLHSQVLVHCFASRGSIIQSLGDSFVMDFGICGKGVNAIGFPVSSSKGNNFSGTSTSNHQIWSSLFVRSSDTLSISKYSVTNVDGTISSPRKNQLETGKGLLTYTSQDVVPRGLVKYMTQSLPVLVHSHDITQDFTNFQNYGYKLSERLNKLIESWNDDKRDNHSHYPHTLHQISNDLDYFENTDEFSSFLLQFMEYYQGHGFSFNGLEAITNLLVSEQVENWGTFYNKLLQCWDFGSNDEEALAREIMKDIALTTTSFCDFSNLADTNLEALDCLSKNYREIADLWDEDFETFDQNLTSESFLINSVSQGSQIPPTIRSSQGPSKKVKGQRLRRKTPLHSSQVSSRDSPAFSSSRYSQASNASNASNGLPSTMAPAFSLPISSQPPVPMLSHSQASQNHKRKKKRVRGFG